MDLTNHAATPFEFHRPKTKLSVVWLVTTVQKALAHLVWLITDAAVHAPHRFVGIDIGQNILIVALAKFAQ